MVTILDKEHRDFLVCSDCAYFEPNEIIDERFPEIKRGLCTLHNKIVDNRWGTDCDDNTYYCCCDQCWYITDNVNYDPDDEIDDEAPFTCPYKNNVYDTDKVCKNFRDFNFYS